VKTIRERVLNQSEGNPFFMEELVRALVESGQVRGRRGNYTSAGRSIEPHLPSTVSAVLASRMDRLPDAEKEILQTAAVIGKEFSAEILRRIVPVSADALDANLRRLTAGEFIVEQAQATDGVFSFKHPLTQEVAYASQLHDRRKALHAAVADVIPEVGRDRLEELSGLIAFHQEAAGQTLKAARFSARAAAWVTSRNPSQALSYWAKVRDLLAGREETPDIVRLRLTAFGQVLNLGWRLGMDTEAAARSFEEATALADRVGDVRSRALMLAAYGRMLAASGSADEYVAHVERGRQLVDGTTDAGLQATMLTILCQAYRMAGRVREALAVSEEGLARICGAVKLDDRVLGFSTRIWLKGLRAQSLMYAGRLDEARAGLDALLEDLDGESDVALHQQAANAYVELAGLLGDADLAGRYAAMSASLAEQAGSPYGHVYALTMQGIAHAVGSNWDRANAHLSEGLILAHRTRSGRELEARILIELARVQGGMGDVAGALETVDKSIAVAQDRRARVTECLGQIVRASIGLAAYDPTHLAVVDDALVRAESLLRETGAEAYRPQWDAQWSKRTGLGSAR